MLESVTPVWGCFLNSSLFFLTTSLNIKCPPSIQHGNSGLSPQTWFLHVCPLNNWDSPFVAAWKSVFAHAASSTISTSLLPPSSTDTSQSSPTPTWYAETMESRVSLSLPPRDPCSSCLYAMPTVLWDTTAWCLSSMVALQPVSRQQLENSCSCLGYGPSVPMKPICHMASDLHLWLEPPSPPVVPGGFSMKMYWSN